MYPKIHYGGVPVYSFACLLACWFVCLFVCDCLDWDMDPLFELDQLSDGTLVGGFQEKPNGHHSFWYFADKPRFFAVYCTFCSVCFFPVLFYGRLML